MNDKFPKGWKLKDFVSARNEAIMQRADLVCQTANLERQISRLDIMIEKWHEENPFQPGIASIAVARN